MSSIYGQDHESKIPIDQTKSCVTYLPRCTFERRLKKSEIVPSDIHSLIKQTGKISDTPRKGTMFGCRKHLQVAASHLNDYKAVQGIELDKFNAARNSP
jgi:hypothetical protein